MFTPIKTAVNVLNDTILNTPLPQATSTVRRKSTLESKFSNKDSNKDLSFENELTCREVDSSLGLLDTMSVLTSISTTEDEQKSNYPNTDANLEYARKLLWKCSDLKNTSPIEMNKENNTNVQNVTENLLASNFTLPSQTCVSGLDKDEEYNINRLMSKASMASLTFEPNEITARSSGISSTTIHSPLNKSSNGMNFSATEVMAQQNNKIMAQLNDEEFLSNSKMAEQLSADEVRWQQDRTFFMPVMTTEKQKLDLSSFSGIIGQLDLSVESCAGRKVSVGNYFARKSGNVGNLLENVEKMRPDLGFPMETPIKTAPLQPLVESTIVADVPSTESKEYTPVPTRDIDQNSVISLSTIVNTLQDANSETPRRLVDELLMAQKKKKQPPVTTQVQDNARKDTYTLNSDRKSMFATSSGNYNKFHDNITSDLATKLSLDSRIRGETKNEIADLKQEYSALSSFHSNRDIKETESFMNVCKEKVSKEEISDRNMTSFNQDAGIRNNRVTDLSYIPSKQSRSNSEDSYTFLNIKREETIRKNISDNTIDLTLSVNTNAEMQSDLNHNVVIGKNTEQSCNCIVGMTCDANIELVNNGDRWITYSLKLVEVLGDRQSIELNMQQDAVLIKPNGAQSTKIEVKIIKMCKPIFVELYIILSDMVAKSKWFMKHMIFVNPEQLELEIMCDSHKEELDFQYIGENSTKTLPITFHNKNSIAVPVKLFILHDGPKIFSIESGSQDELTQLVLKPYEKCTVNVKCDKLQLTSMETQRQPQYWKGKLIVHVQCDDDTVLFKKDVPLYAQTGTCKIQVIDTEIPIVVPRQQAKVLNIVNSGNVTTHVSATIVPIEGYSDAAQDFSVKPDNIFLQAGENGSFLIVYKSQCSDAKAVDNERNARIKLVAGNNVYHYIICAEQKWESEKENYLRCYTPNNIISLSPATSPQSVTSSRSGPLDRNSPISMVSSVAVAGNTIPIRATHAALVWNSVKTGKSEIKEFTIRNTSNNKIKIQIDMWDAKKSFKFLGDRQTVTTSMVLAMQRQEIKTLAVVFSPYHIGPAVGKITIKHYTKDSSDSQQHKKIPLYGYGGCGKVKVSDTFKDAGGKMWLSLGTLSSETTALTANITLQNVGDLSSFAKIKVVPKVISPTMDSSWHISQKELILNPRENRRVAIEFYPKKEDFAILQRSEVSHVATINVTYGDESTRLRIRRLYNKIEETGGSTENENEAFKNIVHPICKAFPGEQIIPGLTSIRDTIQNLSDLCTGVHQYEITLTVEACADDTLPVHYDTDESQMYYSLISDTTHIDEAAGASFFTSSMTVECEAQYSELGEEQFTVTPSTVVLNPPIRNEATVTVLGSFKAAQPFQTNLSNSSYFSVVPAEGMLPSRRGFPLKVKCSQRIERNTQAVLEIYTENSKQDVLINVIVKRQ
ncbi:uncharacterized protein LOC105285003 isoform X2 [Ooceraea biroi]|uniref:uncharacterized protein LOC105285003 isoform X2 n=1 Tax=Ooceraea biroi TaxID=2015173 RepID=UPI0005B7BD3C|nr:uncharacterized protein LOC105285003 isoform X2 [Ooceraea biroi]